MLIFDPDKLVKVGKQFDFVVTVDRSKSDGKGVLHIRGTEVRVYFRCFQTFFAVLALVVQKSRKLSAADFNQVNVL